MCFRGFPRVLSLSLAVAAVLFLPALVRAQQPAPSSPGTIQVSVDRVNVGVIVTDSTGKFVEGLPRDDFHVFDGGVEQPITDFAPVAEPAQVLLLVEAGPAVYFLESGHVLAAHALLEGLSIGDRVAVVKYDAVPQGLLDFTADKQAAAAALDSIRYYVGFGSLDLSRSLSTVLDWLAKVQGKKSIVLLSTGFDTSPPPVGSALLSRVRAGDVRILALSLSAELRSSPANGKRAKSKDAPPPEKVAIAARGFADADRLLTNLTETTGGRVFFPQSAKDFADVYAQIAQLVRHEYSLAFAPPQRDGKIHAIEVRVTPPSVESTQAAPAPRSYRIDHRREYVAPTR
jgi:Ca-activated chloride channel homolog